MDVRRRGLKPGLGAALWVLFAGFGLSLGACASQGAGAVAIEPSMDAILDDATLGGTRWGLLAVTIDSARRPTPRSSPRPLSSPGCKTLMRPTRTMGRPSGWNCAPMTACRTWP
jgi:hypothetical protein